MMCACVPQSWSVTVEYFQQQTFQTSGIISRKLQPFPSVTVCAGTVLRDDFVYSKIPHYTAMPKKIENCSSTHQKREWLEVDILNRKAILHYLRCLSNAERWALGTNIKDQFLKKCSFGNVDCVYSNPKDFHFFSHPYFGNCFTFNPAFDEDSGKMVDIQTELFLALFPKNRGFQWSLKGTLILIHPPGTAPLMESPDVTEIVKGENTKVEVDLVEMNLLKKRKSGVLSCVDGTNEVYRKRSRYYTPKSPYKYSLEVCLASCSQDHAGIECGTINKYLPAQSFEYEVNKTSGTCRIEHPLDMESCNCPLACKRIDYKITRRIVQERKLPCNVPGRGSAKVSSLAELRIKFRRPMYEKIEEQLCYTLADYLGILGGNISLWIGLCIISLLELVELVIKLLAAAVQPSSKIVVKRTKISAKQPSRKMKSSRMRSRFHPVPNYVAFPY